MVSFNSVFTALAVTQSVSAKLDPSNPFPNSSLCPSGSLCANVTLSTVEWVATQQSDPDYNFYSKVSNFKPGMAAGQILHLEEVTKLANYTVPMGLTMSRFVYTTEDINGTVFPASAYVLWPYESLETSQHNKSGLPMVAWAHGTTGVFQPCAPSSYRNLQYHFQVPFALALQGIAVVAADYAGLGVGKTQDGTTIPHPWIASPAQANDVAYAVTAARSAFPDRLAKDGRFVTMGHSQGGGAAVSTL